MVMSYSHSLFIGVLQVMERQVKVEADLRRDLEQLQTRLETARRGHEAEGQMYQVNTSFSTPSLSFSSVNQPLIWTLFSSFASLN